MKHAPRSLGWIILAIVLVAIVIILLLLKCCHCVPKLSPRAKGYEEQMIIWKDPDSSAVAFQTWLGMFKDSLRQYGEITDSAVCPTCDSTLILLSGPGPLLYIQQQLGGGSGGHPTPGEGHNGPAWYCSNLDIHEPEQTGLRAISAITRDTLSYSFSQDKVIHHYTHTLKTYPPLQAPSPVTATVTLAVFDTGIDSTLSKYVLGAPQSCNPDRSSTRGWNFVSGNSNTRDDDPIQHGSNVTGLILDQVQQYNPGSVNILPIKVLDSTGTGRLYDLLCGIAYAANSGAKVFNLSLGFYYYPDTASGAMAVSLLSKYLQKYLKPNNIILVAAAGNQDPAQDAAYITQDGFAGANPRNLDSNRFYPACLAGPADPNTNNVFTITTISLISEQVSPLQNFSANAVDVGVNCDVILNDTMPGGVIIPEYVFAKPLFGAPVGNPVHTLTGSSFAAPVIAGRLSAEYNSVFKGFSANKGGSLKRMMEIHSTGQWPVTPPTTSTSTGVPPGPQIPMIFRFQGSSFKATIRNEFLADRIHYNYKN